MLRQEVREIIAEEVLKKIEFDVSLGDNPYQKAAQILVGI
jgi:hypothetical protein